MSATSPDQADQRAVLDPYKRATVACNRCRGRKTKCLGEPPRPCDACADANQECVYSTTERKVVVRESYLHALEDQVRASGSEPASSLGASSTQPPGDIDDAWFQGMGNLYLSPSGRHQYVGSSSSTDLVRRLRNFVNPASAPLASDARIEYPMYDDATWPRRPANPVLPQLPPYEFAKRLYAAQHIYIGTIFSFLRPQDFEERLNWVYSPSPNLTGREASLAYCQILLVFAYGQMYSVNQWSGNDGPPGFAYFKHALRFLPDISEEGSILFVEVLSLIGYYLQNLNRRDAAFLYIGLALRMAISLGLHQEVSDPSMDAVEREHRRRVWWSVYSMDRIQCVKSGNPITIEDEDIGVALPSPMPGRDAEPSIARTLSLYTVLSKILGNIGEGIYRKKRKSGASLIATVQSIMYDLSNWLRDLPPELRLDFTRLDTHISREAVSIFLHYYQCVNMTARPLLFHVVQRRVEALVRETAAANWTEELSLNTVAVIENSIAAARASTLIMSAAAKHNLVATYGFMDGEHAFSAALVLVMVNIAFPFSARNAGAMHTALSVLRGMADRGNTHIGARYSLLVDLTSVIGKACSGLVPLTMVDELDPNVADHLAPQPLPAISAETDFNDISFTFNPDDDVGLWDEISDNIAIDMDFDWIETALRRETDIETNQR